MSNRELKHWLSKRRESRVLKRIREHLILVNSCITKARDFYTFWEEKDEEAAKNMYDLIHQEEKTADIVEADILDMLSEGRMPVYVRADLVNFIRLADKSAGRIKQGTSNLLLLIKQEFPESIVKILKSNFELLVDEVQGFTKVFDSMFSIEHEELVKEIEKVSEIETAIDKNYKQLKYELAYSTKDVPAGALIVLDHAIRDIELSSDLIEDCAEMVRSLVLLQ
ncbi:MAG: DUF47 family protein [Candidatus Heimdallarchaeota archaeon]|nr:DUF47 family protein [Candidatus Heimdallarchaeota archaeon]